MSTCVLVSAFRPFRTLSVCVSEDTDLNGLYDLLTERYPQLPHGGYSDRDLVLSTHSGPIPPPHTRVSSLKGDEFSSHVNLRLVPRCRGGKGGFGSQLRAAGGRMSSQKTSNNDSCRDLSGRRLSTIKEAKRLADYIESEPARKKAQQEAQKAKLEALEKKLGITSSDGAGPSSEPLTGKKHRLEDTEYVEQSKELVENVRSAVSVAMLKKKKKVKTAHSDSSMSAVSTAKSTATAKLTSAAIAVAEATASATEPILESSMTAPVVAAAAVVAGVANA